MQSLVHLLAIYKQLIVYTFSLYACVYITTTCLIILTTHCYSFSINISYIYHRIGCHIWCIIITYMCAHIYDCEDLEWFKYIYRIHIHIYWIHVPACMFVSLSYINNNTTIQKRAVEGARVITITMHAAINNVGHRASCLDTANLLAFILHAQRRTQAVHIVF